MQNTRIQISGKHINELSENIPSNIFALNELIKNSYDACASYCQITLDPEANQVIVQDDGHGLGERNIHELFHISESTKRFGHVQTCGKSARRIQGSKGLGFLAAFRFGPQVTWDTNHNGTRYVFSVDKKELTQLKDIATHNVGVETHQSTGAGTTIIITSTSALIGVLLNYFSRPENNLKLVGAFTDPDFEVELALPDQTVKTNAIPVLKDINSADQLLYVTYDSQSQKVLFYRNGYLEKTETYELACDQYELTLRLMIYSLESHGRKKISPYFLKPDSSSVTPLTFINDNLFNNYSLFDADILRSKRSSSALPQIVGYVNIYSDSKDFEFNSDRTNFVENATTTLLAQDIRSINELIQQTGSTLKAQAKKQSSKITGPAYPKGGATTHNQPLLRATIELSANKDEFTIPSPQIDLLRYVDAVTDSKGKPVPISQLQIEVDRQIKQDSILSSITNPSEKVIYYKFNDSNTGNVVSKLILRFKEKSASISGRDESKALFYILGSDVDYCVQITNVATLMNEISEAHKNYPKYTHLVACSLRTIFELSSQAINRKRPIIFTHKFTETKTPDSTKRVLQVIHFLGNNKNVLTEVASALSTSFNNLNNSLDKDNFRHQFEKSNVGAHSGTQHLTTVEIGDIAKVAGYYAVFCDALIHKVDDRLFENPNINEI